LIVEKILDSQELSEQLLNFFFQKNFFGRGSLAQIIAA
jgi:hypothetical protein